METNENLSNIWGEEYDFPLKKDGELNPEYKKILNLLHENETLKSRVKFLEESHYYDGYKFRNLVSKLRNKIKELETELEKANNAELSKWKENDTGYSNI